MKIKTMAMARAILFVDQSGEVGGAERVLLSVARPWCPPGRVVLLADGPFQRALEAAGVPTDILALPAEVRSVRREGGLSAAARAFPGLARLVWRLARLAARHDLLYANTQKAFVLSALAAAVIRVPLVWHLHDILTADHFSATNRWLAIRLANLFADRVIAISPAVREAFVAAGGDARRVVVVDNGVDPAPFMDLDRAVVAASLRGELGLPADTPLVGMFARLAEWKGQHVLIEAVARLPHVHAVIVGGPLFGAQDYEARLRRMAASPEVAGRVHFLGFRQDVAALMAGVDVAVHGSVQPEPFGLVIVEAMLAGTPVVASSDANVRWLLDEGRVGVLFPPGRADSLAGELDALLSDAGRRHALSEAARDWAEQHFRLDAMLDGIARAIDGPWNTAVPASGRDGYVGSVKAKRRSC
jgi:glycosyltransferase involved in cell wall biosynthesis